MKFAMKTKFSFFITSLLLAPWTVPAHPAGTSSENLEKVLALRDHEDLQTRGDKLPRAQTFYGTTPGVTSPASMGWFRSYVATPNALAVNQQTFNYQCFWGSAALLPKFAQWISFDALWKTNIAAIQKQQNYLITVNNVTRNINDVIRDKILLVSEQDKVDARLILAVMMQESTGKLDVACTGVANCGIMQGPPGSKPYNPSTPLMSIEAMIRSGVEGQYGSWPSGGPGIAWYLQSGATESWTGMTQAGNPYQTLRAYNSGKVCNPSNLDLTCNGGTASYVNDIANRLLGWSAWNTGIIQKQKGCPNNY
ncbi:hypothetical protein HDK90DRAFT_220695 [Phyllosticta capitalensis]|uniref:Transglycosylase SLT domain-containing protein n=1 Tax=Phyllosticta capitalensis TaxID=121624 RepID=A0ABR1YTG8_9PEZI